MLTGPTSPTKRLRIATQTRASSVPTVPTVPRSVPNSAVGPAIPQDWNPAFPSPVTTAVDRSPSLADVSPVSTTIRWGAHPQPSPVMSDPGPPVDPSGAVPQHSPVTYNYMIDGSERALSYSPVADPSMMQPYPTPAVTEAGFGPPHSGPQMTSAIPSPAFTQFPNTPQSFMATSPHEADPNMQMMQQRTPVESGPVMYNIPNGLKEE
jgi:hypothetical protein